MIPLLIVGSGGHARVVLDSAFSADTFDPVGFIDDRRPVGSLVDDLPVLGSTAHLAKIAKRFKGVQLVVAIGDNFVRSTVVSRIEGLFPDVSFATVVDPSAAVSRRIEIGAGSMINAGSVVNPSVRIGRHTIFNNSASIAHDNHFGDFSSTGPGVTTGGDVRIGPFTHIGIGATISHSVSIGEHAVIGAGALVIRDTPSKVVVKGVPGKVVRDRVVGERYL
jgi:sugar O-acyltransferase (sialic acid O-acetyltransferase NeuD family)